MKQIEQSFSVSFKYNIQFTSKIFNINNETFKNLIEASGLEGPAKLLFIVDSGLITGNPTFIHNIKAYTSYYHNSLRLVTEPMIITGGEEVKNDTQIVKKILKTINDFKICRHSFVIGLGGGALLDLVGFASSIAHRGIRHIRIPTTVLAQNDSGVGVKNSINYFNKKNFLGCFSPPYAVLNDSSFLQTLSYRDWRSGIAEAIKVALIKDKDFFRYIKENTKSLVNRDMAVMEKLIYKCAALHLQHIASGDPFEKGSSRPLDFGHWAAHKLEQVTNYSLKHGEAVAIGIALDTTYSYLIGYLTKSEWQEIIQLISDFGFDFYIPELAIQINCLNHPSCILTGLNEFREHLGGVLTITLLKGIGKAVEVNEMKKDLILKSVNMLEDAYQSSSGKFSQIETIEIPV